MARPDSEDLDAVFKALADKGRRVLLDALHEESGRSLASLCDCLDMSRQAVSKHLAILEEAGLVMVVWQGREKLHYLDPSPLALISERWVGKFNAARVEALAELKERLEGADAQQGRRKI